MKTISLKIPESLEQRLRKGAADGGVSKSELLRQALEAYLSVGKQHDMASVSVLAGDLAGCFSGPADLSSDPIHMADFGR